MALTAWVAAAAGSIQPGIRGHPVGTAVGRTTGTSILASGWCALEFSNRRTGAERSSPLQRTANVKRRSSLENLFLLDASEKFLSDHSEVVRQKNWF